MRLGGTGPSLIGESAYLRERGSPDNRVPDARRISRHCAGAAARNPKRRGDGCAASSRTLRGGGRERNGGGPRVPRRSTESARLAPSRDRARSFHDRGAVLEGRVARTNGHAMGTSGARTLCAGHLGGERGGAGSELKSVGPQARKAFLRVQGRTRASSALTQKDGARVPPWPTSSRE